MSFSQNAARWIGRWWLELVVAAFLVSLTYKLLTSVSWLLFVGGLLCALSTFFLAAVWWVLTFHERWFQDFAEKQRGGQEPPTRTNEEEKPDELKLK